MTETNETIRAIADRLSKAEHDVQVAFNETGAYGLVEEAAKRLLAEHNLNWKETAGSTDDRYQTHGIGVYDDKGVQLAWKEISAVEDEQKYNVSFACSTILAVAAERRLWNKDPWGTLEEVILREGTTEMLAAFRAVEQKLGVWSPNGPVLSELPVTADKPVVSAPVEDLLAKLNPGSE